MSSSSSSSSSGDGGVESERQTLVVYRGSSVGSSDGAERTKGVGHSASTNVGLWDST